MQVRYLRYAYGHSISVNKHNLKGYVQSLNSNCGADVAAIWGTIEDFIRNLMQRVTNTLRSN